MTGDVTVIELDPDKLGTATVQENGMLYVGRDLAGEDVHFAVALADDG
jgi:hypothetical protein